MCYFNRFDLFKLERKIKLIFKDSIKCFPKAKTKNTLNKIRKKSTNKFEKNYFGIALDFSKARKIQNPWACTLLLILSYMETL